MLTEHKVCVKTFIHHPLSLAKSGAFAYKWQTVSDSLSLLDLLDILQFLREYCLLVPTQEGICKLICLAESARRWPLTLGLGDSAMALMRSGSDIPSIQSSSLHTISTDLFLLFFPSNDGIGYCTRQIVGWIIDGSLGLSGWLLRGRLISYDVHQCVNWYKSVTTWQEISFTFSVWNIESVRHSGGRWSPLRQHYHFSRCEDNASHWFAVTGSLKIAPQI